jgi:signal transduction histidine kinase/putative methionine-R-sulfoxide reductase with GAF domain
MSLLAKTLRKAPPRSVHGQAKTGPLASFQMALLDRAHQHAAVAALGQAALTGVELPVLLEQAAVFVAQTLSLDFASIYQLDSEQQTLRMIAGFGWNSGVVNSTTIRVEEKSMAAYVLKSNEPVIVRDARTITAFEIPEYVRAHGVVSGISVVVPGQQRPWGVLEAQSRRGRVFVEDDFHFLQSVANVISTAHARKQSEADREHLAVFVENNPNPVIELDADAKVIYCNDAARVTTETLHKQNPCELLPGSVNGIVRSCLADDNDVLNEQAEIGGRTFSWSFFPIARIGRVHGYAVDVTERLSLEAQLRQSQKMEAIGQLAAGVAHDFNNILTIMQGLVRRLGLTASQEQNDMLEQLFETTERAASLTKQLLAFSRKQVLKPRVLLLGDIMDKMSRMLQRVIGEHITLKVECANEVPPIEADAAMLEQIALNLAVNARDAMPRGGQVTISTDTLEITTESGAQKWVRLRVQDTGSGIPPEIRSRIFEPFYTTKEVGKGTGLGLATVFGIVKQHGGLIDVESEVGQGSTFTILFPPSDKQPENTTQFAAKPAVKEGSGETILLVEDEPLLRELARMILADAGYKVLEAEQSAEAFALWKQHQSEIDLLLTDMVLPGGMTGRELALDLQKRKPNLKVIYTTGYSQDMVETSCDSTNFLQKPYPPETLMRTVRTCLDA